MSSTENWGPNDRISTFNLLDFWSLTLTSDLQSQESKELWSWSIYLQKVKIKGHSVQKLRVETAGRTIRQIAIASSPCDNAVGNNKRLMLSFSNLQHFFLLWNDVAYNIPIWYIMLWFLPVINISRHFKGTGIVQFLLQQKPWHVHWQTLDSVLSNFQ